MNVDSRVQCAPFTASLDADPIGTAGFYRRVVVADVPLPWPRDVAEMDVTPVEVSDSVRLLASVPAETDGEVPTALVTCWDADDQGQYRGRDFTVPASDLPRLLATLAVGEEAETWPSIEAPSELLVCGHGKRDRCCGRDGVRLGEALDSDRLLMDGARQEVRVRRVSHLGGHRFAPTAISFPSGRWWAFLDVERAVRVVAGDLDAELLIANYRGLGLLPAPAQVLERRLLVELADGPGAVIGAPSIDADNTVTLPWAVGDDSGVARAVVSVNREIPVIECGSVGPVVTKHEPEWGLSEMELGRHSR